MKSLLILRHAKSSWENAALSDFERPLNSRGLESIQLIGHELYNLEIKPDLVLSSPAKRAKQTAILVKESGGFECEIKYQDKIYEASVRSLLNLVSEIDDKSDTVLIVGHNPGLEELIRVLTGKIQVLPTATFVKLELDIENWSQTDSNCGNLAFAITPKELKNDNKFN
jgi:phosphohistidine phosphatase